MKKEIKNNSVCVRITAEESKMVELLRDNHCVNISKLIRKFIRNVYEEKEKKDR